MTKAAEAIAWIEANHFVFSGPTPGPYRFETVPYMRGIVDSIFNFDAHGRVVFVASASMGKSELLCALADYAAAQSEPAILAAPTVQIAETLRRRRFQDTVHIVSATSAEAMRSRPLRYVFADEIDAYPSNHRDQGDPLQILRQRTLTFPNGREVWASSPSSESRIMREYLASDRRQFFVSCPHCAAEQVMELGQLRWMDGKPETTTYLCASCGTMLDERCKPAMMQSGRWAPTAKPKTGATIGFHVSSLYSPWLPWADLARAWDRAKNDPLLLTVFRHLYLAEVDEVAQAA